MKQYNLSRKKRQLKNLAGKLQYLVLHHRLEAGAKIDKLIQKIKNLAQELTSVLSRTALQNILGAAAVLVGISFSNPANAQLFDTPVANPFGLKSTNGLAIPAFVDIDGDGDQDLLVGEYYGKMRFFQNNGSTTKPHFAAPLTNPFGLISTYELAFPAFADLDGDGDMDLLVGENFGAMQYFQNTGTSQVPHFAAPVVNPFGIDLH
jgi:hypothetical protein